MDIENDDQNVEAANERAIEEMRSKVRAPTPEREERRAKPEEEEEDEELSLDDDEEGDSEGEPEAERAPRATRRRNRFKALQEEARAAREEAEASKRAYEAMVEAQSQREQQGAPPQRQQTAQRDYDAEYRDSWAEQQKVADYASMLAERYAKNGQQIPQEEYDGLVAHARRLEAQRHTIMFEKHEATRQPQRAAGPAVHPVVVGLKAEFPDVFANGAATTQVKASYQRLLSEGKPDSPATIRAAVLEARERVLGVKPPSAKPTANEKAKFAGSSAGGQAGGRGDAAPKNVVMMTKEMKRMANSAFPHIEDDQKRWKHWAKLAGTKAMADATKERR